MGDNLIQLITKEDFGDSAAKVANLLVQNGELSLIEIVSQSKLSFEEIKHVLVILIKHNIVVFVNKANITNPGQTQPLNDMVEDFVYRISNPEVRCRLRFPKMLFHIGKLFGNPAQAIMEAFTENGRLTVSDCLAEIEEHMRMETLEHFSETEILEAFATLVKGQYIAQVDKSNYSAEMYSLSKATKPEISRNRRRATASLAEEKKGGKRSKKSKMNPIDEVNLLKDDGLTQDIKARLGLAVDKDKITLNASQGVEIGSKTKAVKEDYTKKNHLFYDATNDEEYMFKINYRKFVHDFRMEYVLDIVRKKLNAQSALIVQALLADSQLFSRASQFKQTEEFTLAQIMEKLSHVSALNEDSVNKYLQYLATEEFIKRVTNRDPKVLLPSYCVNMEYLVTKLQMKTLEKIVEDKFSRNHARVFRILDNLGYLNEKTISDTGLMPIKQARACVMELIAARMVESQDLPVEGGKIEQLYGVRPQQALANLIEEMYKTQFNLKKREEVEMKKLNSLIEVHASEEELESTRMLINKLESASIELDDTLMLFCEF